MLTGVSVVEVAGCCRECVESSSVLGGRGAGVRMAAGAGGGVGPGEAGAVWVTALLWISPLSPLVT